MIRALCATLVLLTTAGTACQRMTEEEALEAARNEIRRELQPELEMRHKRIAELEREIGAVKARIAEQNAKQSSGRSDSQ